MLSLSELNKCMGNKSSQPQYLTDKGSIHLYLPIYDRLFTPYRDREINIFEVGYQYGGSCELWGKYFPKAKIKAIDNEIACSELPILSDRITLDIIDVKNITSDYFKDFQPDIAIDDGSHILDEQIHFIKTVYPVLKNGGLMILEDIQDIDEQTISFRSLGIHFEIIDLRNINGRYDDVLIIYRK